MRFPPDWTPEDIREWMEDYAKYWYDKHKPTTPVPDVFEEAFDEAHEKRENNDNRVVVVGER